MPLGVDPQNLLILADGISSPGPIIPPAGAYTLSTTVPGIVPLGVPIWMQAALASAAGSLRLTNPVALAVAGEPMSTIQHNVLSGHPLGATLAGGTLVITNQTAWASFWQQHQSIALPPPPPPVVDFTQHAVIAVIAGTRPSGGFSLTIDAVVKRNGVLHADTTEAQPGVTCGVPAIITHPFHIVTVPVTAVLPSTQENRTTVVYQCP